MLLHPRLSTCSCSSRSWPALASLALGLLVVFRGGQRRIGWLLVAHAITMAALPRLPETPEHEPGRDGGRPAHPGQLGLPVPVAGPDRLPAPRRAHRLDALAAMGRGSGSPASCCSRSARRVTGTMFADAHDAQAASGPVAAGDGRPALLGLIGLLLVVGLFFGSFVSLWRRAARRHRRGPRPTALAALGVAVGPGRARLRLGQPLPAGGPRAARSSSPSPSWASRCRPRSRSPCCGTGSSTSSSCSAAR